MMNDLVVRMVYPADKRLDMALKVTVPINSYILSSIIKEEPVPINIYNNNNEIFVDYFLENVRQTERPILEPLNPVNLGSIIEISERLDNSVIRTLSENLGTVKSIAYGELYTSGKSLIASFRFSSRDIDSVGGLIKKIVSLNQFVDNTELTKSSGILSVLDSINGRIPLTSVTFSFTEKSEKEYLLEWRGTSQNPQEALRYPLEDSTEVVPDSMSSSPTSEFLTNISRDHIPLGSYFELHGKENSRAIVHVPTCLLKSFLIRLYETMEEVPGFRVESIEKYGSEREKFVDMHII